MRAEGAEADGAVGPADPVKAIDEAIGAGGFHEIIISTLPAGGPRWLRMDVPNRVKRKFKIPVTTVTASQSSGPRPPVLRGSCVVLWRPRTDSNRRRRP